MIAAIQEQIQGLAKNYSDHRLNVYSVQIQSFEKGILALNGRVLEAAELQSTVDAISQLNERIQVDTTGVDILRKPENETLSISTNLASVYTAPSFYCEMSSQLTLGNTVEVLGEEGRWAFIRQLDGYLAWVYKPYLTDSPFPTPTHLVMSSALELHSDPNDLSPIVTRVFSGTRVKVETTKGEWAQISINPSGWLHLAGLRSLNELPKTVESRRPQLITDSQRMIGVPYLWGGTTGNGIDCSGFARLLHSWVGISIPRDADMQSAGSKRIEPPYQPGDLFFFGEGNGDRLITHVGVSLGGWKMIHSSRSRNGVYIDDVQEKEGLRSIFVHAGTYLT